MGKFIQFEFCLYHETSNAIKYTAKMSPNKHKKCGKHCHVQGKKV